MRRVLLELALGWVIWAVGGQLLAARVHHVPFSTEQAVINAAIWAAWVALRCTTFSRWFAAPLTGSDVAAQRP